MELYGYSPCAFTACKETSLSLQLLLKNGTKHFYSDAQLFTIFHSQTLWNTTISLTKAIFANKCANVITIHALVPIFLSTIILQKSHHDISWLPTQVTDMYCIRLSLSCPAGNSSTSSPHKWVAANLLLSRIIYRGTRRWLKGQALELGADERTILICLLFKFYEVQSHYIFLFLMNHWFKNTVFLMLSRNLSGKLTVQLIHEQCALNSRKWNNNYTFYYRPQ